MRGLSLGLGIAAPRQGVRIPSWVPRDEANNPALIAFGPAYGYWFNGKSYSTWADFAAAVGSITMSVDADGSYRDNAGTRQNATANVLRFDHDDSGAPIGWLLEGTSTNRFVNPLVPTTQTISVRSSNRCAVSMKGSGSLTLSGAASATVTESTPHYFDASGSLTVTVNGSVTWVQVDDNPPNRVPTSLIRAGGGAQRDRDVLRFGPNGSSVPLTGFSATEGTIVLWGRTCPYFNTIDQVAAQIDDGSQTNRLRVMFGNGGTTLGADSYVGGAFAGSRGDSVAKDTEFAVSAAWAANDLAFSINGNAETKFTTYSVPSFTTLRFNGNASNSDNWGGWIQKFAYFARRVPALGSRPFFVANPDRVRLLGDSFASAGFTSALQALLGTRILTTDGVGGSSLSAQLTRWTATPSLHDQILVMTDDMSWAGESFTSDEDMLAVYAQILSQLSGGRFLIVEPGMPIGGVGGSDGRAVRDRKWNAIVSAYPANVVPVTAAMQAASDGSALDIAYVAADLWPGSCLADPGSGPTTTVDGHLNTKGNGVYAQCAYAKGQMLGYW